MDWHQVGTIVGTICFNLGLGGLVYIACRQAMLNYRRRVAAWEELKRRSEQLRHEAEMARMRSNWTYSQTMEQLRRLQEEMLRNVYQQQFRQQTYQYQQRAALRPSPCWAILKLARDGATAAKVTSAFKKLALVHHPDHGGSNEAMARLLQARDQALREVAGN
jgi:hypothetical protein